MIKKKSPLVSVIMNCYNGELYLAEAIKSILSQTYKNFEVIFWDNQSRDKSAIIYKSFKDKSLNLLKDEIDSSFKEVAVVNFDRTSDDINNSREPSLKEVIKNLEEIMYKWKKYMSS